MGKSQSRPETAVIPDSQTDLRDDPPFVSECEVFCEGGPNSSERFAGCEKNSGHPTFIPVKEFTMNDLPNYYRTEKVMKTIQNVANRTVKVIVKYTSYDRPDTFLNSSSPYPFAKFKGTTRKTRCGTGIIMEDMGVRQGFPCRCRLCKESGRPSYEYRRFLVKTAAHVIFDHSEAEKSTFELFYDSEEDREEVKYLYGVGIDIDNDDGFNSRPVGKKEALARRCNKDMISIFCVTHDLELDIKNTSLSLLREIDYFIFRKREREESKWTLWKYSPTNSWFGVIISHPHGRSKHITVGYKLHKNVPDPLPIDLCEGRKNGAFPRFQKKIYPKVPRIHTKTPKILNIERGSRVKFGRTNSPTISDDESFQQFMKYCSRPKDYSSYYCLKKKLTVSIPAGSPFLVQTDIKDGTWSVFPQGTRFLTNKGKHSFPLPDNTKFRVMKWMVPTSTQYFETYEIDTCPGSSGAPIIDKFQEYIPLRVLTHSGTLVDGTNRSSLYYSADFDEGNQYS